MGASAVGALAVGKLASGALAVGAFAIGALAVGALAIGRLEIRKARLREVEIDSLTVRHLKVIEEAAGEPNQRGVLGSGERGEEMELRTARFVVIMLAALSLGVGIGHLMQLPARMAWDQYLWVGSTVQGTYALSGPLGVLLQVATIIALIVLALLLRRHGAAGFAFTAAAAVIFAMGLLIWWVLVYPVNVELAKWVNGPVPDNWAEWRSLWEWGQAANGLAQLFGFAALIASLLVRKAKQRG
jgi:hypothetical protein